MFIGPTPPDRITYILVSGLLNIADKQHAFSDIIYETLWNYGRCLTQLMESFNSKRLY